MKRDWRCSKCGILLAKIGDEGLSIHRGNMQATMAGEFHASIVCYRPQCRQLNVLRIKSEELKVKPE